MEGRGKRTVNANDVYERTPLHLAAQEGRDELVEFFLKKGAKIDRSERTSLIMPPHLITDGEVFYFCFNTFWCDRHKIMANLVKSPAI